MDLGIAQRTAFVSGATQGIGAGTAEALAREGADLFLVARSADALDTMAGELQDRYGVRVRWAAADFSLAGEGERVAREAQAALGDVDIVVNNAGRSMPGSLQTTAEDWARSQQLNCLSHLEVIRTLLPGMRQRGWGRVINIVGTAYRHPTDFNTGTIAKYGLLAASQVTARTVAPDGVTVNAVTVGFIDTPQISEMFTRWTARGAEILERIPMGRLGRPEEVASAVLFFASAAATYCTASTITLDGGADSGLV
jgi:3-oxoacyl-[acyl-carrier protein] reductase